MNFTAPPSLLDQMKPCGRKLHDEHGCPHDALMSASGGEHLEDDVTLPEHTEVQALTADEAVHLDEATAAELADAMKEADSEEGVPAEEVFAALPPWNRTA
ncbi:MAG: hypothetical protein Q8L14_38740 [Myxococcales bacterium]|nr:hypothetical protein [Myxococcales bacterium]